MYDMHCNHCGGGILYPERGIVKFDGRFCNQECKNDFESRRIAYIMRGREGVADQRESLIRAIVEVKR